MVATAKLVEPDKTSGGGPVAERSATYNVIQFRKPLPAKDVPRENDVQPPPISEEVTDRLVTALERFQLRLIDQPTSLASLNFAVANLVDLAIDVDLPDVARLATGALWSKVRGELDDERAAMIVLAIAKRITR